MQKMSVGGFSVISSKNKVVVNGKNIPIPKGMETGSQSIINEKLYIGWYEFIESEGIFRKIWGEKTESEVESVVSLQYFQT